MGTFDCRKVSLGERTKGYIGIQIIIAYVDCKAMLVPSDYVIGSDENKPLAQGSTH